MHHGYVTWRKKVESEVADVKLAVLKTEAAKQTFMGTCQDMFQEIFSTNAGTELGCDPVEGKKPSQDALEKKCKLMYDDTIARVYKDTENQKAEQEKKQEKEKKEKEDMMIAQPELLME